MKLIEPFQQLRELWVLVQPSSLHDPCEEVTIKLCIITGIAIGAFETKRDHVQAMPLAVRAYLKQQICARHLLCCDINGQIAVGVASTTNHNLCSLSTVQCDSAVAHKIKSFALKDHMDSNIRVPFFLPVLSNRHLELQVTWAVAGARVLDAAISAQTLGKLWKPNDVFVGKQTVIHQGIVVHKAFQWGKLAPQKRCCTKPLLCPEARDEVNRDLRV
mmetsp:Transcript_9263/g.20726  ORF Transcript_9263/g.20726 Transcript_9263/m.20726 type:complete len:217 (-) Transcript_9263:1238-1888(-)